MRNLKKVLSLVLCMAMMLSIMVVGAGAAFKDQSKIVNEEAVDMCSALNIINGYTDGSFKPEGNITRAEACKMICIALNGGKEPILGTNVTASFTDIKGHWAEGYIEYCVSEGIVAGVGGGKFNPNGNVTGSQFAKMLLTALGYSADHEKFLGNAWEVNVNVKATQKGLYEDLETMDPSVALTRDNAAQMVWNALQAKEVKYEYTLVSENGQLVSKVTVKDDNTYEDLMADKYGTTSETGVLEAAGALTINSSKKAPGEDKFIVENKGTFELEGADLSDLIGKDVKVVYKTDKNKDITVYGVFATTKNTVQTGIVDDLSDVTSATLKLDGKKLKLDENFAVYAKTGAEGQYAVVSNLSAVKNAFDITIIDNNDDENYDIALIDTMLIGKVMSANNKTFTIKQVGATDTAIQYQGVNTLKFDYEDKDIENPVVYDGMAKDDYVVVSYDAVTGALVVEQAKVLENAEITSVKSGEFTIDGTVYKTATADANTKALVVGDTASFVVYGNYIYTAYDVNSDVSASDYVVVLGVDDSNQIDGARVKVLKADGKTDIYVPKTVTGNKPMTNDEQSAAIEQYGVYTVKASGEKYKFYVADDKGAFDDKLGTEFKYNSDNNARTTLGGARIADDAVILYLDKDGDPQMMTGATLRGTKSLGTVTNNTHAAAWSTEASSGVDYVQFAWLGQVSDVKAGTDSTVYAYVDDICGTTKDGDDTVATISVAAGEGKSEILVCNDTFAPSATLPKAGDFIKYEVTNDGKVDIDTVTILAPQDTFTQNKPVAVAITGIEGDSIFATTGLAVEDGNWFEFLKDEDTQVIYINVQKKEGGADVGISTAGKDENGYVKNAYVVYEKDGSDRVIKAIFVESDNDINS